MTQAYEVSYNIIVQKYQTNLLTTYLIKSLKFWTMFPQDSIHLLHISGSTHGLRTEQILYLGLFLKKHNLTILLDGYQMSPGKTHCIKTKYSILGEVIWCEIWLPIKLLLLLSSLFFSLIFRFLSLSFTKSKILQKLRDLFTFILLLSRGCAIFSRQKK